MLGSDLHHCHCSDCDPKFAKQLEQQICKEFTDEFERETKDGLREEMVVTFRDQVAQDADHIIRRELRKEVLREELAKQKERLRAEMEQSIRSDIKKEMTAKWQEKMAQMDFSSN